MRLRSRRFRTNSQSENPFRTRLSRRPGIRIPKTIEFNRTSPATEQRHITTSYRTRRADQLKEQKTVVVKFSHLNFLAKNTINFAFGDKHILKYLGTGIKNLRFLRIASLLAGSALFLSSFYPPLIIMVPALLSGLSFTVLGLMTGKVLQHTNNTLRNEMGSLLVLDWKYRKQYPRNWKDLSVVAETHPVFFVNQIGNVVFKRDSILERFLRRMQEMPLIHILGIHPWRWRNYVKPPSAEVLGISQTPNPQGQ